MAETYLASHYGGSLHAHERGTGLSDAIAVTYVRSKKNWVQFLFSG